MLSDALDLKAPVAVQTKLYAEIARTLRGQTFWLARRASKVEGGVQGLIDAYRPAVDTLQQAGTELLSEFERQGVGARRQAFIEAGAPEALASTVAGLRVLAGAVNIADLARETAWPVEATACIFNATGYAFGFDRLRDAAASIDAADEYERAALRALLVELIGDQTVRTRAVMDEAGSAAAGDSSAEARAAIDRWMEPRKASVERARRTMEGIEQTAEGWSFAKLSIANAALRATG